MIRIIILLSRNLHLVNRFAGWGRGMHGVGDLAEALRVKLLRAKPGVRFLFFVRMPRRGSVGLFWSRELQQVRRR